MVAIKIQSIEDIIQAYLQCLSFDAKLSAKLAEKIKPFVEKPAENGESIIKLLDDYLLKTARKAFPDENLPDEQLAALFKFCFLRAGGAKVWGKEFYRSDISEKFKEALNKEKVVNAPVYVMSAMEKQKIEPVIPQNFLHKIFNHKRK